MPVRVARTRRRPAPARAGGFSYLFVLGSVAVTGVTLAAAGIVWATAAQRERETELVFAGTQIREAIDRFYDAGPGGAKRLPRSLDELLVDKRHPRPMHHLRRAYADPMTADGRWVLVQVPGQGIVGVHSASNATPLREVDIPGLPPGAKSSYRDWRFVSMRMVVTPAAGGPATGPRNAPVTTAAAPEPAAATTGPVTSTTPPADRPKARIPPTRDSCRNLAVVDEQRCRTLINRRGRTAGENCFATADARMQACNAGVGLPPLDLGQ